ncbi:beta-lactamase family protein [Paucibacter sp. DJ1R-11]|uniref:serine hydrolase domain-containing protein n=1 Tax=Paucibacter sp. DJ1R-11 TaxID=2893556 RepID=UPI0021E49F0F|nr:serine hydrolase domain-containing protein [Paucibacter sp. DJ1R-11]MCV2361902.1 beta-lactamase family protein [Paucibacter sp. DJ1R-11]
MLLSLLFRSMAASALVGLLGLTQPALAQTDADPVLLVALQASKTPALALLEMRDGKVSREAVVGLRRNDQTEAAKLDDLWATGSDAKPMTVALVARLVDRGLLAWDAPLSKLWPALAQTVRPEYGQITLAQLLSHRAGLPRDSSDADYFAAFHADTRPLPQQRMDYLRKALNEAPVAAAGAGQHYSNTGFVLAGAIAETVTGVAYETLMHQEVFEPLGMSSARFAATRQGQNMGHRNGHPVAEKFSTAEDGNPLMYSPAGAELHMTLRDWAKFCLDQLAGAKDQGKLLSKAAYRKMQTNTDGPRSALGWLAPPSIMGRKGPVLQHSGSDGNWMAYVVLFPEQGTGVLVAANAGEDMGADAAAKAVLKAVLPGLSPAN